VRFLHMADVHLGNQQYNLPGRFDDFGRAFLGVVDLALTERVDVCVIAGDLFHKSTVEPKTLLQAEEGLRRLQDAGTKVIAVHGNHDKVRYMAQVSWLDYLSDRGLCHLLSPSFESTPVQLQPWDESARLGAYVDVGYVRFIGVPWLGASAPRVLEEIAMVWDDLDWTAIAFTVLVTHAGIEGQMPHMPGGVTFAELEPLKGKVQYLALGHLHKPYERENWIYNPGSLETCSFEELQYPRGVYLVDVAPDGTHTAQHVQTSMRPFFDLDFKTDLYPTPALLMEAVQSYIHHEKRHITKALRDCSDPRHAKPVVRLVLRGNLSFDRTQLDMEAIREMLRSEIDALLVRVENRTTPLGVEASVDEGMTRLELEQAVFTAIARSDSRYGSHAEVWADIMAQVKTLALTANDPERIFMLLDGQMRELEEAGHVDH
jgi:exonuclease SbcD